MKPLQDYVNEDSWNWDTFLQVAKEANKDTNNDGKLDSGDSPIRRRLNLRLLPTKQV
ncbi:hypothetical protein VQ056_32645 [Paenibacillus sp. JTLBN-2024]